ncbi:MAG: MAPEG family protein [Xanthobacteraceae bacterium]
MSIPAILAPAFVLVALTFFLHYWMGFSRVTSVTRGETKIRDIALRQPNWPARTTQIANAYHNQFELPVLFYVLVAFSLFTRQADLLFVAMSWPFVALRLLHAYVMVTSNHVPRRFQVHFAASAVLLLMWAIFAIRILVNI